MSRSPARDGMAHWRPDFLGCQLSQLSQLSQLFPTCPVPLGKCLDGFSPSEQLHDSPSLACPCRSAAEPRGSQSQGNQRSPGNSRDNPGNPRVLLSLAKSSPLFGMSFDLTMEFWILGAKNLVMRLLWRLRLRGPAWPAACNACTWVATT